MKRLIFLFASILMLSSCAPSSFEKVSDPKKETTQEIIESPKDTVLLTIIDNKMIITDQQNVVLYKLNSQTDSFLDGVVAIVFLLIVVFLILGAIFG